MLSTGSSMPVLPSVRVIMAVSDLAVLALTLLDTSIPEAPNKDDFRKFLLSNVVMILMLVLVLKISHAKGYQI
jgi:hypothetical protein